MPVPKGHILHLRIESRRRWLMYSIPSTLHLSVSRSSHLDFRTFRAQPPRAFINKWKAANLKERSAAQEHFLDLCRLLDEPTPAEVDPEGAWYCFERGASKLRVGVGEADVWKRGHFSWEYKGKHKDLPHSTGFSGKGCPHSAKPSRREDLDIEEPVACRYATPFHFHATLPGMLGATLIRDEVVQVGEPREKSLLAAPGVMKAFHGKELPLDGVMRLIE